MKVAQNLSELIGRTPVIRIESLSRLTGCEIFAKCEQFNPGGSIKDRAALQMVTDAVEKGQLKPGMTIVEGTAGNTGIGLAVVARSLGFGMIAVLPRGQAAEKERMIGLHGAELRLVDPCPFSDPGHFYHTARRIAEEDPERYWWANQFDNPSNFKAHYGGTGPELWEQLQGRIDHLVSVAGTGGTIGGNSVFLKEKNPAIKVSLVDPEGSGLCSYVHTGEFRAQGSSLTEGIGIMRLVENFRRAKVDEAFTLPDQDLVTVSRFVRDEDGLVVGASSALNLAGALRTAVRSGAGKRIVTFLCELGERAYSKLYNPELLASRALDGESRDVEALIRRYRSRE